MVLAQDLRDAVLQTALQGKLTEQLETDSSVDVLLQGVKAKKKKLIDKGDIKREKVSFSINKEDIPFEIPSTWKWTRMQDILDVRDGTHDSPTYQISGVPFITSKNLIDGKIDFDNVKYISQEDADFFNKRSKVNKGDILMAMIGSIGKPVLVDVNKEFAIKNVALLKKVPNTDVNMNYVLLLLYYSEAIMKNQSLGGVQKFVSLTYLRKYIVALPPIEEQQRIVDRVNELMKKIDEYEKVEKELVALEQRFPDDMKNALLQAAMQGKLTEQLDSDSSVDELIDKCCNDKKQAIEEGKYRKERYRGAIENSKDLPCKIPENWRWVYISDMSLFQEGPGILAKDFRNSGVPLIRISGMKSDKVSLEGCNYLDENMVKNKWNHFKLDLGDIVISTSASMDKIAEVQEDTVNAILYTGLIRFKMYGNINKEYFKYFIKSPFYLHQIDEQKAGGTIKHYGPSHLKKMIIPLPPVEEQQRIVEKLEQLLPLCETL